MDAVPVRDRRESRALAAERHLRSTWWVFEPDGRRTPADDFDYSAEAGLADLFAYEHAGSREAAEPPAHVRLMREHQLADYEPASDPGNLRWYPKGSLIKRLLERHVSDLMAQSGALQVETPVMYDLAHPELSAYLDRFPARQYVVRSDDREHFLRFAACFGQYMIARDAQLSHRHLPLRLYELAHYAFRREQSGELAGMRRLRAFTMPDMHTVVASMESAKTEFADQVRLSLRYLADVGVSCAPALRIVRSFHEANQGFVEALASLVGRPILVEVWDERFFYFVAKFELNFLDAQRKAACLSTVQIDVENAERFGIDYVDGEGGRRAGLLLHTSISGAIDRNVYALLETQAMRTARGERPALPTWLAPTQVRLVCVSDEFVADALSAAQRLGVRCDVDDRDLSVSRKVRDAERGWVPYVVILGERERGSGRLSVRPRGHAALELTEGALTERIEREREGRPFVALGGPTLLSRLPAFVG